MSVETSAAGGAHKSVADAVDGVNRWRAETEEKHDLEIRDAEHEIESLESAIANLKQQLETLGRYRAEIVQKREVVGARLTERLYGAIFGALRVQVASVAERAEAAQAVEKARKERLAAALRQGDLARLVEEYEQYKTSVEPTLAALPASYRSVIEQHHQQVASQLRGAVEKVGGSTPADIEGEPVEAEVIFAVDAPDGVAELIMLVIPVVDQVRLSWQSRHEDAQTWLAARSVQAVYEVCKALGLPHAQAMFGGHQGLLAVEVELAGGDPAVIRTSLGAALERTLGSAPELSSVKIKARPYNALVDHLLPPEEDAAEVPNA